MALCSGDVAAAAGIDVGCCDGCMCRDAAEVAAVAAAPWPSSSCDGHCRAAAAGGAVENVADDGAVVWAVGCGAADRWRGVGDRAACGVGADAGAGDAGAGRAAHGGARSSSGR